MEITVVSTEEERNEMEETVIAYSKVTTGEIGINDFLAKYKKKVWIDYDSDDGDYNWIVVDNTEGRSFSSSFITLDGAMLYATGAKPTEFGQVKWDRYGMAEKNRGFVHDVLGDL